MAKARCRKCNKKVSGPKVDKGTFVGDPKNFHKTGVGQKAKSGTPAPSDDPPSTGEHPTG